ncbi:DUF2938 domain-containing protein [Rhodanobacter sp. Si-c]|uniref:DUF2938 domain-containing protein n=1 Tax=Rhodanobacter lycopersici TaxID=3162487 RepID=A0ABV3QI23_9GAMM
MGAIVAFTLLVGIGATLATDLWAWLLRHALGVPSMDWALAGRWFGHLVRGRFAHQSIAQAAPVRGERALGWLAHYATGIVFAAALLALAGPAWAKHPTLPPALGFGLATVIFPFALLQPGMGAGFAASRTPRPNRARLRSLLTHAVFGFGLYVSGLLAAGLLPQD